MAYRLHKHVQSMCTFLDNSIFMYKWINTLVLFSVQEKDTETIMLNIKFILAVAVWEAYWKTQ